MTDETFTKEIREALSNYDKYVVCIGKTVDECESTLTSLMRKAIHAFETRAPGLRHGIALDRHITIILSQSDSDRPHCGIYFNLHSPYQKQIAAAAARREQELADHNKPDDQDEDDDDDFETDSEDEDDDFEED